MPITTAPSVGLITINKETQRENKIISYIRNCRYDYSDTITCDYESGKECGVLYLSMIYHKKNPDYIETRYNDLSGYKLKVLLVCVDIEDVDRNLYDINSICQRHEWTLILSYSFQEASEYLENLTRSLSHNERTVMRSYSEYKKLQQVSTGENSVMLERFNMAKNLLTSIRTINSTNALDLLRNFGSIKEISKAGINDIALLRGLGMVKAKHVVHFFNQPFLKRYGRIKQ
uniref:HHH_2 domain-containing protein n=1 Tax=Parastrongyloides trichosuri TaxID=131310 RepID=A0A0N4ZY10_PARTI